MTQSARTAPEYCAQCGEDIPPHALACPGCGADERTGWRDQSIYDGLDLPDEEPSSRPQKTSDGRLKWWGWLLLVLLIVTLAATAIAIR